MMNHKLSEIAASPYVCCAEPRPACALFNDPAAWLAQDWRCLRCGKPWPRGAFPPLRTYGELVEVTLQHVERKRLNSDGSERTRASRGVTRPRPVRVVSKRAIGKEVIVDPTDTDEGLTAEQLNATSVLVYRDPTDRLQTLREAIARVGVAPLARASGVSRSQIKAILHEGAAPRLSTIKRLEEAIARSRA
jgi:DNA-binding phage protein